MERRLRVEFGPSRSKRFAKAVALAQGGPGECAESEPGRYRVTFLLAGDAALFSALGRLLERVRHWRASEVYEGDELVSSYQAKEMAWSLGVGPWGEIVRMGCGRPDTARALSLCGFERMLG